MTVYAGTGAFRAITSDLLAETYLAPRPQAVELNSVLKDGAFPWSASMDVSLSKLRKSKKAALKPYGYDAFFAEVIVEAVNIAIDLGPWTTPARIWWR